MTIQQHADAILAKHALVTVCAWCPDSAEQTAAARAQGREVTHGICPSCQAKMESAR